MLTRADALFKESGPAIADTIKNVNVFSKALGDASSGLNGAISGIGEIGRKIGPLAGRLEKFTDDADKLLGAVDAAKIKHSVDDVAAFAASLGAKDGPTQHALADARRAGQAAQRHDGQARRSARRHRRRRQGFRPEEA